MSNFDFLDNQPQFKTFYKSAVDAEKALSISPTLSVIGCRRSMECATKWLYRVEPTCAGNIPDPETLMNLMREKCYRSLVDKELYSNLHLLRKYANLAVHNATEVQREEGIASLWVLFQYYDWIDQFYGSGKGGGVFSQDRIEPLHQQQAQTAMVSEQSGSYAPRAANVPQKSAQSPSNIKPEKNSSGWGLRLPKISIPSLPDVNVKEWTSSAKAAVDRVIEDTGNRLQKTRKTLGNVYDGACSTAERLATYSYDVIHDAAVSALKVTMSTTLAVPEITAETWRKITQRGAIQQSRYVRPKADAKTTLIFDSRNDGGYDDDI